MSSHKLLCSNMLGQVVTKLAHLREVDLSSLGFSLFNCDGEFLLGWGDDDDKLLLSNDGWDFVSVGIGVLTALEPIVM